MKPKKDQDEITLKDLLLGLQAYVRYCWQRKGWLLAAVLVAAAIGVYKAYTRPAVYTAEISFMVNEEGSSSLGGVGAILGQIGLGSASVSEYNMDKIVELAQSRRIVAEALLDSFSLKGQMDVAANQLIRSQNVHEKWNENKDEQLHNFYFTHNRITDFTRLENKAFKAVYNLVAGDREKGLPGLLSCTYDGNSTILRLKAVTESEDLSLFLVGRVYEALSVFYIQKATEKQEDTYEKIASKTDSVARELNSVEYRLAQTRDRSLGLSLKRDQLTESRLNRELQILTIMYGEAIKNREAARFMLENARPFFQLIDPAIAPLPSERSSVWKNAILWGVLGGGVAVFFLVINRFWRQVMQE